jgi:hypothetical protein
MFLFDDNGGLPDYRPETDWLFGQQHNRLSGRFNLL